MLLKRWDWIPRKKALRAWQRRSAAERLKPPEDDARPHHVVVDVDRGHFHSKLREIEAWIAEWEMDAEIGSVLGSAGLLRVHFADEKAAYVFRRCFSGRSASLGETAAALAADAAGEDLYERLARDYPD